MPLTTARGLFDQDPTVFTSNGSLLPTGVPPGPGKMMSGSRYQSTRSSLERGSVLLLKCATNSAQHSLMIPAAEAHSEAFLFVVLLPAVNQSETSTEIRPLTCP